MSGESIQRVFEEEREEDDEAWIDRFENSKMIYDDEREKYNRDEPNGSRDKWEKVGLKLEGYSLCSIDAHTIARQDMEVLKDDEKSESTKGDLDDI
jgi:predicted 3-demethylubiquinone-9 3-methyltransferase (glyoxalase superfamily)